MRCKKIAQTHFVVEINSQLFHIKEWTNFFVSFFSKKLSKVNNRLVGENSPYLVILFGKRLWQKKEYEFVPWRRGGIVSV
jgi:hypothetical protein